MGAAKGLVSLASIAAKALEILLAKRSANSWPKRSLSSRCFCIASIVRLQLNISKVFVSSFFVRLASTVDVAPFVDFSLGRQGRGADALVHIMLVMLAHLGCSSGH